MTQPEDIPDIREAFKMYRAAQSSVLRAFESAYPALYRLSARAFEQPLGSLAHRVRLGEFLTEWDNALGQSPIECLIHGRTGEVHEALSLRARLSGFDEDRA